MNEPHCGYQDPVPENCGNAPTRGRPATGRNTKVIRVPKDFDRELAIKMYYDWLPVIRTYAVFASDKKESVRWERLIKLLEELGEMP